MIWWMLDATPEGAAYLTAVGGVLTALAALVRARSATTEAVALRDKLHDHEARLRVLEARQT